MVGRRESDPPGSGRDLVKELIHRISEWQDFAKSARDWLWTTDAEGRFIHFSEQYQDILNEDPADTLGKTREEVVTRYLDQDAADKILADIAEHKPFRDLVYQRLATNGRRRWVRASGVPSFDAEGRFAGYRGAGSDVTEFVTTWERRNQLALMIHSAPFGMMMVDSDLRIQMANAALWDFIEAVMPNIKIGSSLIEFIKTGIAMEFTDLGEVDEETYVRERLEEITSGPSTIERHVLGASLEIRTTPLPDGSILFYFLDVSEQRRLRQRVMQSQRIEAMGHLTAGIAHDFNNIMEVILGSLELLRADPRAETADDLIDMAMRATERGAQLTGQLLCFSGEAKLSPQLIRVEDVILKIEPRLRQMMPENVELECRLAPNLLGAWMDPKQFEGSLFSLVQNALDAMPEGGRLTLLAENREGGITCGDWPDAPVVEDEHVSVSVIDTGIGMTPELRDKALEPFFTTKEIGRGSGLGLSMVHGFTMQSSGHFTIESAPGLGTTVRLCFPGFVERRGTGTAPDKGMVLAAEMAHILIVEDTDDVRNVIRRQLEREGYRISEAVASQEALEVLAVDPSIDLILSDVVMPGELQGPEMVARARTMYPGIRTILMSGYPWSSVGQDFPLPEDVRLLAKPMSNADLLAAIRETLAEPVAGEDAWAAKTSEQPAIEQTGD